MKLLKLLMQKPASIDILDLIDKLKDNPILLAHSLHKRIEDIALSDNTQWINATFDAYVTAQDFKGLYDFWQQSIGPLITRASLEEAVKNVRLRGIGGGYSEKESTHVPEKAYEDTKKRRDFLMSKFKNLSPEQRITLSQTFLGDRQEEYLLCPREAMEIVQGLEQQVEIENNLITKPQFFQRYPVTAVKKAVKNENYDAVALTFAHLRKKGDYWSASEENHEIKALREKSIYFQQFQTAQQMIGKMSKENNSDKRAQWETRARVYHAEIIDDFNDLVREMKEPKKAFGLIARTFSTMPKQYNDLNKIGEMPLAIEYALLSNDADLLFEISKSANAETRAPFIYEDRPAAFKGLKALLSDKYNLSDDRKTAIKKEISQTFADRYVYSNNEEKAVEAAKLSENYFELKHNFLETLERKNSPSQIVYDALIAHGDITSDNIMRIAEDHIRKNIKDGREIIRAIEFAGLISHKSLDAQLIEQAFVQGCVNYHEYAKDALNYMTQHNLHTPATKAYMEIEYS
ncbi:MAG: hypothetical protein AABX16_04585 [Nanoarchaeota archaeon]